MVIQCRAPTPKRSAHRRAARQSGEISVARFGEDASGDDNLDPANAEIPAEVWELPTRQQPAGSAPVLTVDGFEGPLDWLLEMARAQRIDLAKLSILAVVEAFTAALNAALAQERAKRVDLSRWGEWLVMAAHACCCRRMLLRRCAGFWSAGRKQGAGPSLDEGPRLGREVFGRGGGVESAVAARHISTAAELGLKGSDQ
jgi:hypothetical protein